MNQPCVLLTESSPNPGVQATAGLRSCVAAAIGGA